jgi:hypothetical protein
MDSKEFNQRAKWTETASSVIFDVRGFGARQCVNVESQQAPKDPPSEPSLLYFDSCP